LAVGVAVLLAVGATGALAKAKPSRPVSEAQFLRHAARALRWAHNPPGRRGGRVGCWCYLDGLREQLLATTRRHPTSGRAYLMLSQCDLAVSRYEEAVGALERAAQLPDVRAPARAELTRAQRLLTVAKAVRPHLPAGSTVVRIESFSAPPADRLWAVVSAKQEPSGKDFEDRFYRFSDVRLTVLSDARRGLGVLWQSQPLVVARPGLDAFSDLPLYVLHPRGSSADHLVLDQTFVGGSWSPSHLSVFAWDGRQLRKLLGANGDCPLWIQDVDGDGRAEVGATHAIGHSMAHAEMPLWTDIYAWDGRAYVLANSRFPREFRDVAGELRTALRAHPADFELLKYQGLLEAIRGHHAAARRYLRRAERACQAELQTEEDRELRAELKWELGDIGGRLARPGSHGGR
jgi:hypothetical protein